MNIKNYDYQDGDKLSYFQYSAKHFRDRYQGRNWFFTFSSKQSWLKKQLFVNLIGHVGPCLTMAFIVSVYNVLTAEEDFPWPFMIILSLVILYWTYSFARSYYFAFVKPQHIQKRLQRFVKDNRLEVVREHSVDRLLVSKEGYVFLLDYAYDHWFYLSDYLGHKCVLTLTLCYTTKDRTLLNSHGLVTLGFERDFNKFCEFLAQNKYMHLDELRILAVYPLDTPSTILDKAIGSFSKIVEHFGLTVKNPDIYLEKTTGYLKYEKSNYLVEKWIASLSALFGMVIFFFLIIESGTTNKHTHAVPIAKVMHYYQCEIKSERCESDTLFIYANMTSHRASKDAPICISFSDEASSDSTLVTLGYCRQKNVVVLLSSSTDLSLVVTQKLIGGYDLSLLPPQSVMTNQSALFPDT